MSHLLLIPKQESAKELSKIQKQFNSNIKKIDDLKQKLTEDTQKLQQITILIQTDIIPLEQKRNDKLVELVYVFDRHHADEFFKKKEKWKIADFILEKTEELIKKAGKSELESLYDKYAGEGEFEASKTAHMRKIKSVLEVILGIELDDQMSAELDDPAKLDAFLSQKLEESHEKQTSNKQTKKKTAKQIEKEEKIKAEAKNISKAARTIYTDLVKEFHPDFEQNEAEKERKTEIMKRIIQAYENDDLFELLRLKIELLNADITTITLADDQLKYYNKLLQAQISELETALLQLRMQTTHSLEGDDLLTLFGGNEKTMKAKFKSEINRLKNNIKALEGNIAALRIRENMREFLQTY